MVRFLFPTREHPTTRSHLALPTPPLLPGGFCLPARCVVVLVVAPRPITLLLIQFYFTVRCRRRGIASAAARTDFIHYAVISFLNVPSQARAWYSVYGRCSPHLSCTPRILPFVCSVVAGASSFGGLNCLLPAAFAFQFAPCCFPYPRCLRALFSYAPPFFTVFVLPHTPAIDLRDPAGKIVPVPPFCLSDFPFALRTAVIRCITPFRHFSAITCLVCSPLHHRFLIPHPVRLRGLIYY